MHDIRKTTEDRLRRVLEERLQPAIYTPVAPLNLTVWHVEGGQGEPVPFQDAQQAEYSTTAVGDSWGPAWGTSWFRVQGEVPAGTDNPEVVFNLGFGQHSPGFQAEGLVYTPDGTVIKAINPFNQWIPVNEHTAPGGKFDVYVEAAANPNIMGPGGMRPTNLGEKSTAGDKPIYTLERADINELHQDVWELVQDLEVLGQLERELDSGNPRKYTILLAVEKALDALDLQDIPGTAAAARAELEEVMSSPAAKTGHRISAVGHAHIDSAWLWPLRETVRKVGRTTANVVNLMEDHPDYIFAMSQAQQLAWLKEHKPGTYAKVKDLVKKGQFVPVGGMWVESDTNMVGSEAMARQFVHGKRFFMDEFGVETQEVWLPDSFGYSAALPQIVKLAGNKWFLTQKISWNTTNKFPHHTFMWEGLDGTQVFTHFPPIDTYNSDISGGQLAHAVRNFQDKGAASRSLAPFGWGDGGGGPTREMLARIARTGDLEGSAQVVMESPRAFFEGAEADYQNPPVWSGELYLEYHRATYTSQAKNKQGNRKSEHLLYEAELWAATAALKTGFEYPYAEFDRLWKQVLLLQFHDILPGTSIAWVHRETADMYQQIFTDATAIIEAALAALAGEGDNELVVNSAPHARGALEARSAVVRPDGDTAATVREDGSGWVMENENLRVTVDADGTFSSVFDKRAEREVLAAGQPGNLLQLHPDFPNLWDAWDVEEFYRNTVTDLRDVDSISIEGKDSLRIKRSFGDSSVDELVRLAPGSDRVEFELALDWHEVEKFLKLSFGLDVLTERSAAEIQYGHIYRPTHQNTSWDAAKFEICAHRWVQVEEPGYGVAVTNDSTYGHDISRKKGPEGVYTDLRLSVIRAPRFPDQLTDQGEHTVHYALVPGASTMDAVSAGYQQNLPVRTVRGGAAFASPIQVDNPAVVPSAVKLADDESGDVIVRVYEATGGRNRAQITPDFEFGSVAEVDLLERDLEETSGAVLASDSGVEVSLKPFQIVTLRFKR